MYIEIDMILDYPNGWRIYVIQGIIVKGHYEVNAVVQG